MKKITEKVELVNRELKRGGSTTSLLYEKRNNRHAIDLCFNEDQRRANLPQRCLVVGSPKEVIDAIEYFMMGFLTT